MPLKYDKLFELLKSKGLKKYDLRKEKVVGVSAMESMRTGVGHVDTRTIEKLCASLDCQPGDFMEYIPDENISKGEQDQ